MMMAIRRLLAGFAVAAALVIGLSSVVAQAAPTPTPTTGSSASSSATPKASATASDTTDPDITVSPDVAPDNSRTIWILSGAAVVAIAAAAVVIAKR